MLEKSFYISSEKFKKIQKNSGKNLGILKNSEIDPGKLVDLEKI